MEKLNGDSDHALTVDEFLDHLTDRLRRLPDPRPEETARRLLRMVNGDGDGDGDGDGAASGSGASGTSGGGLRHLTRTPLHAEMLCELFGGDPGAPPPQDWPGLYEGYLRRRLAGRPGAMRALVGDLAYQLRNHKDLGPENVRPHALGFLQRPPGGGHPLGERAAEEAVDGLLRDSGLFVEDGAGHAFAADEIRDYLAADELDLTPGLRTWWTRWHHRRPWQPLRPDDRWFNVFVVARRLCTEDLTRSLAWSLRGWTKRKIANASFLADLVRVGAPLSAETRHRLLVVLDRLVESAPLPVAGWEHMARTLLLVDAAHGLVVLERLVASPDQHVNARVLPTGDRSHLAALLLRETAPERYETSLLGMFRSTAQPSKKRLWAARTLAGQWTVEQATSLFAEFADAREHAGLRIDAALEVVRRDKPHGLELLARLSGDPELTDDDRLSAAQHLIDTDVTRGVTALAALGGDPDVRGGIRLAAADRVRPHNGELAYELYRALVTTTDRISLQSRVSLKTRIAAATRLPHDEAVRHLTRMAAKEGGYSPEERITVAAKLLTYDREAGLKVLREIVVTRGYTPRQRIEAATAAAAADRGELLGHLADAPGGLKEGDRESAATALVPYNPSAAGRYLAELAAPHAVARPARALKFADKAVRANPSSGITVLVRIATASASDGPRRLEAAHALAQVDPDRARRVYEEQAKKVLKGESRLSAALAAHPRPGSRQSSLLRVIAVDPKEDFGVRIEAVRKIAVYDRRSATQLFGRLADERRRTPEQSFEVICALREFDRREGDRRLRAFADASNTPPELRRRAEHLLSGTRR